MLTELLTVIPYVLSLATLSALLLWVLPMLCITAAPHVMRQLKAFGRRPASDRAREPMADVWPRFSDPA